MKTPNNLWPVGIIAAFALFVSGTAGLIVMAASQKSDLISADYYEQELKYQQRIDSLTRSEQLETKASAVFDAAQCRIVVTLPAEHVRNRLSGRIQLYRPSQAGMDRLFDLQPDASGVQTLDAAALAPGLWKARVSWTVDRKDYFIDRKIVVTRQQP
jgi:nitrogen fixation protein FixH